MTWSRPSPRWAPASQRRARCMGSGTAIGTRMGRIGGWSGTRPRQRTVGLPTPRHVTSRSGVTRRRSLIGQRERLRQRNQGLAVRVAHDPLTGLRNRAWFDRAYGAVITRRLRRTDGTAPTAAIMFDLDHFGRLNKQYGHQAGDVVLRRFADLLRDRVRSGDLTARFGGEEFVAVLMDCSREDAAVSPTPSGRRSRPSPSSCDGLTIRTTVSAGCAALEPGMTPVRPAGARGPRAVHGQACRTQHGGRGLRAACSGAGSTGVPREWWETGAPGRNRTCDRPLRRRVLYPLSYEGASTVYRPSGWRSQAPPGLDGSRLALQHGVPTC